MLYEARSLMERDQSQPENQISESDIQTLANTAGNKLRRIMIRGRSLESLDTMERTEFLQSVSTHLAIIEQMAANGNSDLVQPRFNFFVRHFVESAAPSSTVEEIRSYVQGPYGPNQYVDVFQDEIQTFQEALMQASDLESARQITESNGRILWQRAGRRSQNSERDTDDRPLYWTRLRMIQEIRYADFSFNLNDEQKNELVEVFERNSRGMETARFSIDSTEKRVVVSGFDPFGLHTDLNEYNPSGAAVLALDGMTIRNGDISARVEGVIFPLRFRDFNQGIIEQYFGRYLTGDQAVDMIMTISRGSNQNFEIERYAGRRRSSQYQDNEATYGGGSRERPTVPPEMGMGDEFLETSLPTGSMASLSGIELDQSRYPESGQGTAISGSGGGYLSNEIFYRVRRLSLHTMGAEQSIRVGHLHTPSHGVTRETIIYRIRDIIRASIPQL
jgi:pyrrolidone-carboxylate peptidase